MFYSKRLPDACFRVYLLTPGRYNRYFRSWFHKFDAFVVIAGFAVDLIENNTAEEIASLIVILRLWRFVKIVDEFSVEASEEMEEMRKRIEDLESRNAALEAQIAQR